MPTEEPTKSVNDYIYGIFESQSQQIDAIFQINKLRFDELALRIDDLAARIDRLEVAIGDMSEGLILNVSQVAKALGVSRPTVYRLVESGALPAKRLSTGPDTAARTVVLSEDLKRFLSELPSADESPKENT